MNRLQLIARSVAALQRNIDLNRGQYDGRMVPNLQSIADLCTVPDNLIPSDYQLAAVEQLLAIRRTQLFCTDRALVPVFGQGFVQP